MASPVSAQFNFLYNVQYTGGDVHQRIQQDISNTGRKFQAAHSDIASSMRGASDSVSAMGKATQDTFSAASFVTGGLVTSLKALTGVLGILWGTYKFVKAIAEYHDEMIDLRIATQASAVATAELKDQQLTLAQTFGTSLGAAMKLQTIAGNMKISNKYYADFVLSAEKARQVLGISAEQAAQMNYQLTRIPGFSGHFEHLASTIKKTAQAFNVKPEELLASFDPSNPDVARLLLAIPKGLRDNASKQLVAIEGVMRQLGRSGAEMRTLFVKMLAPEDADGKKLAAKIASVVGGTVFDIQRKLAAGELTSVFDDFLRTIEGMSEEQAGTQAGIWAQTMGLTADQLSVIKLAIDASVKDGKTGAESLSAAVTDSLNTVRTEGGKTVTTLDDFWQELSNKISVQANRMEETAKTLFTQNMSEPLEKFDGKLSKLVDELLPRMMDSIGTLTRKVTGFIDSLVDNSEDLVYNLQLIDYYANPFSGRGRKPVHAKTIRAFEAAENERARKVDVYRQNKPAYDHFFSLYEQYYKNGLMSKEELLGQMTSMGLTKDLIRDALDITDLASGGVAKAKAGGTLVNVAEAGVDEAIIPLDRLPTIINNVAQGDVVEAIKWLGSFLVQHLKTAPSGRTPAMPALSQSNVDVLGYRR